MVHFEQRNIYLFRVIIVSVFFLFCLPHFSKSQTFPSGFSQVQVATGIVSPSCLSFLPDGRILIGQKNGTILVYKNGSLLATPFASIATDLNGERGLIGMTIDSGFNTNKYVYIHYTLPDGSRNRIARVTAAGDVMKSNSIITLLNLDSLTATNHNGGGMRFGPDGKLYVGIGENMNSAGAQNLTTYMGKIIRINSDGTVPAGNPYTTGTPAKKRIWCYGLRNPYSLDIQPGTGKIFANDVGAVLWEEINDVTNPNINFGWPNAEGNSANVNYANPEFAYAHGTGDNFGCAITGGCFFNPVTTSYPSTYYGCYFYQEYCNGWINYLTLNGSVARFPFATGLAEDPVGLSTGSDGCLYYLSRTDGALYKIIFTSNIAPVITQQPISKTIQSGQPVSFTVTASGAQPISYQWKKNNINISGATSNVYSIAAVAPSHAGNYKCVVTNSVGTVTSSVAILTVSGTNTSPVATISLPANNSTYAGGDVISFSGSATDDEDGTLSPSAFEWNVIFHHDIHTHPGPAINPGINSGTFTIPNIGETSDNVYYELQLIVTDSQGATDTTSVDILPRKSQIYFNTNPQGLLFYVDGISYTTPVKINSVEGVLRNVIMPSSQPKAGYSYSFSKWLNGATTAIINFAAAEDDTSVTALYNSVMRIPENPVSVIPGLLYRHFTGMWNLIPKFDSITPVTSGAVAFFDLSPKTQIDNFGFKFSGFIQIPTDGTYTFYTTSDDGSNLYIGNTKVVNNDGIHGATEQSGNINLRAGLHAIRVDYIDKNGSEILSVSYAGPGITKQLIPVSKLFRLTGTPVVEDIDDTYVRAGMYAGNYYNDNDSLKLSVSYNSNTPDNHRESFLMFDLTGYSKDFSSASLDLFGTLKGTDLTGYNVSLIQINSTLWDEHTINYNFHPTTTNGVIATKNILSTTGLLYSFDVTNAINNTLKKGSSKIAFTLVGTTVKNNFVEFNSKENILNHPVITFTYPAPRMEETYSLTALADDQLLLYPNPTSFGTVTVTIPGGCSSNQIVISDVQGRVLIKENCNSNQTTLDVSKLSHGIYFVQVVAQSKVFTSKLQIY